MDRADGILGSRAAPDEWIPMLLCVYEELSKILERYGVRPIVAEAGAYGVNVEFDPTKDVDLVLSRPLGIAELSDVLKELVERLRNRGVRVIGARIQLGRSNDDWVIQVFVSVKKSRIIAVEIFNLLAVRPATLYETTRRPLGYLIIETLTLESWFASKLADPNGVDEANLRRLERAVSRIDHTKLFEILRRLSLTEIVHANARDILKRTTCRELQGVLSYLA